MRCRHLRSAGSQFWTHRQQAGCCRLVAASVGMDPTTGLTQSAGQLAGPCQNTPRKSQRRKAAPRTVTSVSESLGADVAEPVIDLVTEGESKEARAQARGIQLLLERIKDENGGEPASTAADWKCDPKPKSSGRYEYNLTYVPTGEHRSSAVQACSYFCKLAKYEKAQQDQLQEVLQRLSQKLGGPTDVQCDTTPAQALCRKGSLAGTPHGSGSITPRVLALADGGIPSGCHSAGAISNGQHSVCASAPGRDEAAPKAWGNLPFSIVIDGVMRHVLMVNPREVLKGSQRAELRVNPILLWCSSIWQADVPLRYALGTNIPGIAKSEGQDYEILLRSACTLEFDHVILEAGTTLEEVHQVVQSTENKHMPFAPLPIPDPSAAAFTTPLPDPHSINVRVRISNMFGMPHMHAIFINPSQMIEQRAKEQRNKNASSNNQPEEVFAQADRSSQLPVPPFNVFRLSAANAAVKERKLEAVCLDPPLRLKGKLLRNLSELYEAVSPMDLDALQRAVEDAAGPAASPGPSVLMLTQGGTPSNSVQHTLSCATTEKLPASPSAAATKTATCSRDAKPPRAPALASQQAAPALRKTVPAAMSQAGTEKGRQQQQQVFAVGPAKPSTGSCAAAPSARATNKGAVAPELAVLKYAPRVYDEQAHKGRVTAQRGLACMRCQVQHVASETNLECDLDQVSSMYHDEDLIPNHQYMAGVSAGVSEGSLAALITPFQDLLGMLVGADAEAGRVPAMILPQQQAGGDSASKQVQMDWQLQLPVTSSQLQTEHQYQVLWDIGKVVGQFGIKGIKGGAHLQKCIFNDTAVFMAYYPILQGTVDAGCRRGILHVLQRMGVPVQQAPTVP